MSKHTEGPLTGLRELHSIGTEIRIKGMDGSHGLLAEMCYPAKNEDSATWEAAELVRRWNAYPELVEALGTLIALVDCDENTDSMIDTARAILAKADAQEGGR